MPSSRECFGAVVRLMTAACESSPNINITTDHVVAAIYDSGDADVAAVLDSAGFRRSELERDIQRWNDSVRALGPQSRLPSSDIWMKVASATGLLVGSAGQMRPELALVVSWLFLPWPMGRERVVQFGLDLGLLRNRMETLTGLTGLSIDEREWSSWTSEEALQPPSDVSVRIGTASDGKRYWSAPVS